MMIELPRPTLGRMLATTLAVMLSASTALAQNAPAVPAQPASPTSQTGPAWMDTNVELEVVITDTVSGKPEAKRVTLLLQNRRPGSIRTVGSTRSPAGPMVDVELALDGSVTILSPEVIQVAVTFKYAAPPLALDASAGRVISDQPASVSEQIMVALRSGRRLLVSRSADPVTNRTVTVELTATIREP